MTNLTQTEIAASWASSLAFDQIPAEVINQTKLQILDCLAAIHAGHLSDVGKKIYSALEKSSSYGESTVIPSCKSWTLEQAVYYHAAMINSLELDNFHFMGHLSESTFSTAFSIAEQYDKSGKDFLKAMIGAQEVTGRLSAYIANGPQQGHMRSYLHRAGGALATGLLLDCSEKVIATAISIALSMPEFSLYPASYSPETKVICTSSPTVSGIKALLFAIEGFEGTLDIIENPLGFLTYFSYSDRKPEMWKHLGKSWLTNTFSAKEFSSCAYAQGPVQATLNAIQGVRSLNPDEIRKVEIDAPITTVVMEKFSKPHYKSLLTPVNINFSTKRSVAVTILFGAPTGSFYYAGNLIGKLSAIENLANKCILNHSWEMTIAVAKGFDKGLLGAGKPGVLSMDSVGTSLSKFNEAFGSQKFFQLNDIPKILKVKRNDRNYLINRYWKSIRPMLPFLNAYNKSQYYSYEGDLEKMEFCFPSRVRIILNNGAIMDGYCCQPNGFAGSEIKAETIIKKYFRETITLWGKEKSTAIKNMIDCLEDISVRELIAKIKE
ncbi:MAG: MmgE/PrpD family protein [Cyclobacteriaceae bacterium]|nr:MmgE/PrpD family protein [Cyclobacteriaceae bacterium]